MIEALIVSNVLLWICVVALALVVFALARQVGVLHERVAPAGALMTRSGPAVGEAAPELSLRTLDERELSIGAASADGIATLLFFLSPTCPVCKTLLPTLLRVAREEDAPVRVILASDGDLDEQHRFVRREGLEALDYVVSSELGMRFAVGKLPYAVLIDGDGVVRSAGIVNTREHLESLFEAQRRGVASIQDYVRDLDSDEGSERKGEAA